MRRIIRVEDAAPNTFRLSRIGGGGNYVLGVEVFSPEPYTYHWNIRAVEDVPISSFVVTVGEVPAGFEQMRPTPPQRFSPVPGKSYRIYIWTDYCFAEQAISHASWIAEQ